MHIYIHIYIHTYIHTYTHTHTYTHSLIILSPPVSNPGHIYVLCNVFRYFNKQFIFGNIPQNIQKLKAIPKEVLVCNKRFIWNKNLNSVPTSVHHLKFKCRCHQHTLFKFITVNPSTWNHKDYISHALLDDKVPWTLIHNTTFNYCNLLADSYIYSTL